MNNIIDVAIDASVLAQSQDWITTVCKAIDTVLAREGFVSARKASVSVLITGDERLRQLNRDFASEDQATDVLSFASGLYEPSSAENLHENITQLGDIAISAERTEMQASSKGWSFERELAMLAMHGTLHLLGYDHAEPEEERVMFGKTDEALAILFEV